MKATNGLSNIFFKTIIGHEWKRDNDLEKCYKTNDDPKLCMYSVDVQFYYDSDLKAIAELYASENDLFLKNLASAWTKLANADRFDGPNGNICDKVEGNLFCFKLTLNLLKKFFHFLNI